ncbi:MAG: antitoxin component YwqK of YwqJK toxin-antitoxin module [Candidatus Omnitrophota bacterium]|jgi:antitoxin component YwqK of YwqJK toxin-antitoxin module
MQQFNMMRFAAGGISGCLMGFLLVGLVYVVPQHIPKLHLQAPKVKIQQGIQEKTDLFGLVEGQWTVDRGIMHGDALQYYSSGALLREMTYVEGELDNIVREYYEKKGYRRRPPTGSIIPRNMRGQIAGEQKAIWTYVQGRKQGLYELYYENGILKEQGNFVNDKLDGRQRKFNTNGELIREKTYGDRLNGF